MSSQVIQKFNVIGISVRTTNTNGKCEQDIANLYQKFWENEMINQIPNAVSKDVYEIYTNYESDYTGEYTIVIGLAVNSLDIIPEGMLGIVIETATYQKFVSKGKMPEAIVNTWKEIWMDEDVASKRIYKADFTIYGEKYNESEHAEIETYISIS